MAQAVRVNVVEHATEILSQLRRMRQGCNHCDFIIRVQDDMYRTHKNVLSAGSGYFRAMFEHNTKERQDGEITFKDVDSECVKNCLDFIYSGEFEIPAGKMKDLLHIGIMLQLDGLKTAVAGVLVESINAENYYRTTEIADMYELRDVIAECQRFYKENLMEIANQSEFRNTPISKLANFLQGDDCKYSEEEKLTILLRWGVKNPKANSDLLESIQRFKLEKVSSTFLINLIKANPVVSNDWMIYKFFNNRIVETLEKMTKTMEGAASRESTPIFVNREDTGRNVGVKLSVSEDQGNKLGSNAELPRRTAGTARMPLRLPRSLARDQVKNAKTGATGGKSTAKSSFGGPDERIGQDSPSGFGRLAASDLTFGNQGQSFAGNGTNAPYF